VNDGGVMVPGFNNITDLSSGKELHSFEELQKWIFDRKLN